MRLRKRILFLKYLKLSKQRCPKSPIQTYFAVRTAKFRILPK